MGVACSKSASSAHAPPVVHAQACAEERRRLEALGVVAAPAPGGLAAETPAQGFATVLAPEPHEPSLVHSLAAASLSAANWKAGEVPEWLNGIVLRLWPNLSDAIEKTVEREAEPAIKDALPEWIEGHISLQKFALGEKHPPKVLEVKCTDLEYGLKVEMDVEFEAGVDIEVAVGVMSVGIKRLIASGRVTLELGPLVGEMPVVGAVNIYFVDPPRVAYEFTGMAKVGELPLIRSAIRSAVDSVIAQEIVLPNSIVTPLVEEQKVRAKTPVFQEPLGLLRVTALRARGLTGKDWSLLSKTTSDAYIRVRLGSKSWSSPVVKNSKDPEWSSDAAQDFVVYTSDQLVYVEVIDDDWMDGDDSIGCIQPLSVKDALEKSEQSLQLHESAKFVLGSQAVMHATKTGQLDLRFEWLNLHADQAKDNLTMSLIADATMLVADVSSVVLPARLAKSVQVRLKVGTEKAFSKFVRTPHGRVNAAVRSMDKALRDIVSKAGRLGVDHAVIAEMTGLKPELVAEVLKRAGQASEDECLAALSDDRVGASLDFDSCLSLPLPAGAATSGALMIEVRDFHKRTIATKEMPIKDIGYAWPRKGQDAMLTLTGGDGVHVQVGIKFTVTSLCKGLVKPAA